LLADCDSFCTHPRHDARVGFQAVNIARRHEIETIAREADDFRLDARPVVAEHVAAVAHGCLTSRRFEREPDHPGQHALDGRRR
jgi:hypothetical protein